jgi:hypothetical protein
MFSVLTLKILLLLADTVILLIEVLTLGSK